ncbi:MAG: hypothetical protein Q9M28_08685 [Mariprofundaceae bacterium]|nr:hypothetical protein [Mariprofundaceae bacterium]
MTDEMKVVEKPSESPNSKQSTRMWSFVLIVYLFLFVCTGYLAFLSPDSGPSYDSLMQIVDPELKAFAIESLKQEDVEHIKRQSLAMQSFNVILGALLGFMSATATGLFQRKA